MVIKFIGQLEIDQERGVIYFHAYNPECLGTVLRICNLPAPIPNPAEIGFLDLTHMWGTNWHGKQRFRKRDESMGEK